MNSGDYAIARAIPITLCFGVIVAINICLTDMGIKWTNLPTIVGEGSVLILVFFVPFQALWPLAGSVMGGAIGGVSGVVVQLLSSAMSGELATYPLPSLCTIVGVVAGAPAGPRVGPPLARLISWIWKALYSRD